MEDKIQSKYFFILLKERLGTKITVLLDIRVLKMLIFFCSTELYFTLYMGRQAHSLVKQRPATQCLSLPPHQSS